MELIKRIRSMTTQKLLLLKRQKTKKVAQKMAAELEVYIYTKTQNPSSCSEVTPPLTPIAVTDKLDLDMNVWPEVCILCKQVSNEIDYNRGYIACDQCKNTSSSCKCRVCQCVLPDSDIILSETICVTCLIRNLNR